jgi:acyl transferase domain-containing protein
MIFLLGTPVGDPIELNAISKVFLQESYRESLLIGGVSNLGTVSVALF